VLIVTGSIRARADTIERVLALSLEHVQRSREEPGCLLHSVHHDAEDPLRLVFLEHWIDADALRAHFHVAASRAFVDEVAALADGSPEMAIYDARPISV
jgi:quinol monooxygenase YgiN